MKRIVLFVVPLLFAGAFTGTAGAREAQEARAGQLVEHRISAEESRTP